MTDADDTAARNLGVLVWKLISLYRSQRASYGPNYFEADCNRDPGHITLQRGSALQLLHRLRNL